MESRPLLQQNTNIDLDNDDHSNSTVIIYNDSSSLTSTSSTDKCRICLQNVNNIVKYCKCLNDLSHIHDECLFEWLNKSNKMNARIEEYDNHDQEYDIINSTIVNNKKNCINLDVKYFYYCEICHYRYNIYNKNKKHSLLIVSIDVLLIIALIFGMFYSLVSLVPIKDYFSSISSLLGFIFLMANLTITSIYSIHSKIYDYKLVILPHHKEIDLNTN